MNLKHLKSSDKEFKDILKRLTDSHTVWQVWSDFIAIFAYCISNAIDKSHYTERENQYLNLIKKYKKSDLELFSTLMSKTVTALDDNPEQDFLGKIYMELGLGKNNLGQNFTAYDAGELIAVLSTNDIVRTVKCQGYTSLNDPCCGSGAILIASLNKAKDELAKSKLNFQNHILVIAQDVDFTAAMMCYIQLSLYGVAGYVKVGNTITEPMTPEDTLENYWFTPMYFSEVWTARRTIKKLSNWMNDTFNKKISDSDTEDNKK